MTLWLRWSSDTQLWTLLDVANVSRSNTLYYSPLTWGKYLSESMSSIRIWNSLHRQCVFGLGHAQQGQQCNPSTKQCRISNKMHWFVSHRIVRHHNQCLAYFQQTIVSRPIAAHSTFMVVIILNILWHCYVGRQN